MSSSQPIDQLLELIEELMQKAKVGQLKPGKITPDIMARLEYIESAMEWISTLNAKTLASLGFTPQKLEEVLKGMEQLRPRDQRILRKTQLLKQDAEQMKRDLMVKSGAETHREKTLGKEGKKIITRKKKFDRLGRKKDWKPL